jgi:hypothetical protein
MSTTPFEGRALLCSFTYGNGHHCRMPRKTSHPFLCTYHARKESQAQAAEQVGRDLADRFSRHYLSGSDLSAALGHLMSAVALGHLKPRAASTLAYLSQTLLQAIHLSEQEYINAHGADSWRSEIRAAFGQPARQSAGSIDHPESNARSAQSRESRPLPGDPVTYLESVLTDVYQNK